MRRALVLCVVAGLLAAACSGSGGEDKAKSATARADKLVPADGRVLAEIEGVGEILEGFADFDADDPEVTASEAGPAPAMEGVLEVGPGLSADVGAPFTGALQVRLDVPEPPTDDAIPVAVHRGADGRASIEPALWDPGASQMVVWATSFSDRWGAWYDPRNWIEETVQVGQGAFDFVADFVTGRTDPPGCLRNDPPAWASMSVEEVSSLHVCAHSNSADDGRTRFELFLKSNRRTAQLVTIPSVSKEYVWSENMSNDWRRLLTSLTGVDANTNMVLLGAHAMSVGFPQPDQSLDFDVLAYHVPRIIIANPVFALLGNLPLEGTLGVSAAVAKCHAEASGIDITRFDAVPDDPRPDVDFFDGMVRCAFETLQNPELAFGVAQEVAAVIGVTNAAILAKINGALRSLAPTAARIASGLAIGSALTNVWDGIFDDLAEGRITVNLAAQGPTPADQGASCRAAIQQGDIDRLAEIAARAINEANYDLVGGCVSDNGVIAEFRSYESVRPLTRRQSCELRDGFECWFETRDGSLVSIDINSGSAGEFITGIRSIDAPQPGNSGPEWFVTPSGNIGCYVEGDGARCDIRAHEWQAPPRPSDCDLDWGSAFWVSNGEASFVCHGDTVLAGGEVLPYGSASRRGAFQCRSEETGVECQNLETGHGFVLSRRSYRFF